MEPFKIITSMPGQAAHRLFKELPLSLYPEGSPRFMLGNDPVDAHLISCFTLLEEDKAIGRCALYFNPHLKYTGKACCTIGSFECIENREATNALLDYAVNEARKLDVAYILGPMEGSTWNNYRFSNHNAEANFFMEPYHHSYYNDLFIDYGFKPIARYISNLDTKIKFDGPMLDAFEERYRAEGAVFRNLNLDDLENDLRKVAEFNNDAFRENFLFTPITTADFVAKYMPYANYFDPSLIWIVEDQQGKIQALSFSIPDHMDPSGKSLIIKTLARRKDAPFKGIGAYLAGKTYQMAHALNYEKMIHALMIQDNTSVQISEDYEGGSYKSYSLYAIEL